MSGSFTGDTPNWVAGYVPPAAEWNQWWSRKLDTSDASVAGAPFLSLAGGTMTGTLILPAPSPTNPNAAVSKSYVDSLTFSAGPFMPLTGGAFSGPVSTSSTLTLSGNPASALHAAPKQYVDASTTVANNALTVANAAVRRVGDSMTGLLLLSGDPVNVLGAVTKQYSDTKLALAGGTVTGNLTVNTTLTVLGAAQFASGINISSNNAYEWFLGTDVNGNHTQTYRTGWFDKWESATGQRDWISGAAVVMSLDTPGNLTVTGTVAAATVSAPTVSAATTLGVGGWTFSVVSGAQRETHAVGGFYDEWTIADGTRTWHSASGTQMTLTPPGNLVLAGSFAAVAVTGSDTVHATNTVYAKNDLMFMGPLLGGAGLQFTTNYYFLFDTSNGNLIWRRNSVDFWIMRTSDTLCFNNLGAVGGQGAYVPLSDIRSKRDITPATCGLDEVRAIEPIEFVRAIYDGRDAPREIGFSAQQVKQVIPLAVRELGIELPDGSGGMDSGSPSMGVTLEPIVAALINGMKHLAAEIEQLKAARA